MRGKLSRLQYAVALQERDAAMVLQGAARMHLARHALEHQREAQKAATVVQSGVRRRLARQELNRRAEYRDKRERAAMYIQVW